MLHLRTGSIANLDAVLGDVTDWTLPGDYVIPNCSLRQLTIDDDTTLLIIPDMVIADRASGRAPVDKVDAQSMLLAV